MWQSAPSGHRLHGTQYGMTRAQQLNTTIDMLAQAIKHGASRHNNPPLSFRPQLGHAPIVGLCYFCKCTIHYRRRRCTVLGRQSSGRPCICTYQPLRRQHFRQFRLLWSGPRGAKNLRRFHNARMVNIYMIEVSRSSIVTRSLLLGPTLSVDLLVPGIKAAIAPGCPLRRWRTHIVLRREVSFRALLLQ